MSRAWMPIYWGDYLKDTGHLNTEQHGAYLLLLGHCWQHGAIPPGDGERAAVVKLTTARWKVISAPILKFFNEDGTQKRISKELEKAERVSLVRRVVGEKGRNNAAIARAIAGPTARQLLLQKPKQTREQNTGKRDAIGVHNYNHIDSSYSEAARTPDVDKKENSTASLASALPTGALRSPSRARIEVSPELKNLAATKGWVQSERAPEPDGVPEFLRRA